MKLLTAPLIDPVTLVEAKAQIRDVTEEVSDDDLIKSLITVATTLAEDFVRGAFIEQTWLASYDTVPRKRSLELPRTPLLSVTEVRFTEQGGTEKTFSNTLYIVDTSSQRIPGRIALKVGEVWPTGALQTIDAFRVEFKAGYGLTAASVPAAIKHGIKIMVADMYEHRESVADEESALPKVPIDAERALAPYKVHYL